MSGSLTFHLRQHHCGTSGYKLRSSILVELELLTAKVCQSAGSINGWACHSPCETDLCIGHSATMPSGKQVYWTETPYLSYLAATWVIRHKTPHRDRTSYRTRRRGFASQHLVRRAKPRPAWLTWNRVLRVCCLLRLCPDIPVCPLQDATRNSLIPRVLTAPEHPSSLSACAFIEHVSPRSRFGVLAAEGTPLHRQPSIDQTVFETSSTDTMNDAFSYDIASNTSSDRSSPSLPLYAVPAVPTSVTRNQQQQQRPHNLPYQTSGNLFGGSSAATESSNRGPPTSYPNVCTISVTADQSSESDITTSCHPQQRHSFNIAASPFNSTHLQSGNDTRRMTDVGNSTTTPPFSASFFSPMRRASNMDTGSLPGQDYAMDGTSRQYQNYQPQSAGHSGGFGTSPTTSTGRLGIGGGSSGGLGAFASTLARSASLGGSRKKAADDVESGFMGLPTHNRPRDEEQGDEEYLVGGSAGTAYGYHPSTPGRHSTAGPMSSSSKPYPYSGGNAQANPSGEANRQAPSKLSVSMQPPPPPTRQGAPPSAAAMPGAVYGSGSQDYVQLAAGSGASSRSGSSMSVAIAGSPGNDQHHGVNPSDPWPQYTRRPSNAYEPAGSSQQRWQQPKQQHQKYGSTIPHVEISPEYTTSLPLSGPASAQGSPYFSPRDTQQQFSSSSPYTADPSPNRDAYGNTTIPVEGGHVGPFGNYLQPASSVASSGHGSPMAYSPSNANDLPYLPTTAHPAGHTSRQLMGARSKSSQTFSPNPGYDGRSTQYGGYGATGNGNQVRDAPRPGSGQGAGLSIATNAPEDKWARPGLRRIRDPARDLHPILNNPPSGKRADPENSGEFLNVGLFSVSAG